MFDSKIVMSKFAAFHTKYHINSIPLLMLQFVENHIKPY